MSYARYVPMIESARRYPSLWRLLAGVAMVVVVMFAWIGLVAWLTSLASQAPFDAAVGQALLPWPDAPSGTVIYLCLIVGLGLGTLIAARFWQKRRLGSLCGPIPRVVRHFAVSAALAFAVMAVLAIAALPFIERPVANLAFQRWIVWLPLGILAIAAQTGSEELLFRGYLQSQFAARFKSPVIWLVGPALIFGGIHYLPSLPTSSALAYVVVATLFGVLAGDLTARTGNIGAAWGFHFANNALVILVVSSDDALTGLSLYKNASSLAEISTLSPLIAIEVLTLAAIWALIRKVLAT